MAAPTSIRYLARIGFKDHWGFASNIRFLTTSSIYTAWLADDSSGNLKTLFDAIVALTLCNVTYKGINNVGDRFAVVPATSESALNSSKLLVNTVDSNNGYADRFYIPGRDPSKYASAGGFVDITNSPTTEVSALLTAVANGAMQSRYGHGVVVTSIKPVGRHLRRQ